MTDGQPAQDVTWKVFYVLVPRLEQSSATDFAVALDYRAKREF